MHDQISAAHRGRHIYASTACQHEIHDRCRKVCKFCQEPCRCECHEGQEMHDPRCHAVQAYEGPCNCAELRGDYSGAEGSKR